MKISIEQSKASVFQTYGGEGWVDDQFGDDYGIQLDNVSLHGIKGEQLARLAIDAINHLMINGHRFEFRRDSDGVVKLEKVGV